MLPEILIDGGGGTMATVRGEEKASKSANPGK